MKKLLLSLSLLLVTTLTFAQTKADILSGNEDITWLGIDYSQVKFIGSATQWQDAGEISNMELRDKYFTAWNNLIENEPTRYKIAEAVNRAGVSYATNVTAKVNNSLKGNFFSEDGNDFNRLDESDIKKLVSNYNFQGKKGIGFMFFAEAMSKGKEAASYWVTFVNMDTKKVILTHQVTAKAGGFGFRNYWAGSIVKAIKDIKSNLRKW